MPLYEYQCKQCQRLTERIVKFSDPPLTECPHCGGEMEQLISAPAVQFKGSGWYVTDYAKSGKSGKTDNSGKSESSSSDANGAKANSSDTKAETSSSDNSKSESTKSETAKSNSAAAKHSK